MEKQSAVSAQRPAQHNRRPDTLRTRRPRAPQRVTSRGSRGGTALAALARAAGQEGWSGPASDELLRQVETRIVDQLSARLVLGLGPDEARQTARVLAWERLRRWAQDPASDVKRLEWGYLSNFVRWRLADALAKQTLRWDRHVPTAVAPEETRSRAAGSDPADLDVDHVLGDYLAAVVAELVRAGMERAAAVEAVHVACDDTDLRRARVVKRLQAHAGVDADAAQALADLLVGNPAAHVTSMVRRLATHEPRQQVVADPRVGVRLERVADAAPAHALAGGARSHPSASRSRKAGPTIDARNHGDHKPR